MNDVYIILKKCILFINLEIESINSLLLQSTYSINYYSKNQLIACEGENCINIGIVLTGSVEIQKNSVSGKSITIAKLSSGNIFGEIIIFSDINKYPSTIIASEKSEIMFISKNDILKLCSINITFLNNFMSLLSNRILLLNKKLKNLSYETLRQKISNFLIENYVLNKSFIFQINYSRQEMAEALGVPRPSLSRELANMKNDGLIDYHKNTFKILDLNNLKNIL